jgi:hypothetical protein
VVYFLSADEGEVYSYGMRALDGDINKIRPIDLTPDGGREILPIRAKCGRRLEGDHMPTRIQIEGPKRKLTDFREGIGTFVSSNFRAEVEKLEPGVHQFFPVEFVWKDGSHACHRFWFVPCNRLDSVDRNETTFEFRGVWILDGSQDKSLVFSRSRIAGRHAWIDKYISAPSGVWISDRLRENLLSAGITGMTLRSYEETD